MPFVPSDAGNAGPDEKVWCTCEKCGTAGARSRGMSAAGGWTTNGPRMQSPPRC